MIMYVACVDINRVSGIIEVHGWKVLTVQSTAYKLEVKYILNICVIDGDYILNLCVIDGDIYLIYVW